jgi:Asp/Glu/hydantoin racemase
VLHLKKAREQFVDRMVERAAEAIEQDAAHFIVLGCTGLAGLAEQAKTGPSKAGRDFPSSTRPTPL